ncbi:heptaprenyl diphosphate synthase [Alteribacillus persepolensis]|uniref:Heptaprenyl diphosphate synthase n=1 Tax=Alteribacillus persepolensis TaxID=568899 RepID=A0A1G7ZID8_9BACI|nr:heptaprenyl diphosphate synthase component 1 [Alteribacillus persepolensis]SDH07850.1 heptaprenyl diphosphate synthase [Alteribacillus persepolensis]
MKSTQQSPGEVKEIEKKFVAMTTHPYLAKHIEKAEIDFDIIFFLQDIMKDARIDAVSKQEQILSALLVQAAFLTHENVYNKNLVNGTAKKPRQLTVLAGDFFSSLYYFMLVKNTHDDILPVFSSAIQRINEEKMSLHFAESQSEEELMNRLKVVEGGFLFDIASFYQQQEVGCLAETFFLLKRIKHEKQERDVKYLSAFASAIYAFHEGERKDEVTDWPTARTRSFLEAKEKELEEALVSQMDACAMQVTNTLYQRVENWLSGE